MSQAAYAIMLDVTRRPVVIVGGGALAMRKAEDLVKAGAQSIRVVAPAIHEGMPSSVGRIESPYRPEYLKGAGLVIAATDDSAVNEAVVEDARRLGILVSRVDAAGEDHGDFTRPAVWHEGNISIAVSTSCAPILSRRIRDAIGEWIDPRWPAMARVMERVRPVVHAAGLSHERRREIFQSLTSDDALDVAAEEGTDGVLRWLSARYPDLGLPPAPAPARDEEI